MKIVLQKCPTTNHIYGFTSRGGFARSYITTKGKEWFSQAIIDIKKQTELKQSIETKVEVKIKLFHSIRQDVDGIIKPTLDALGSMCLNCQQKFSSRTDCICHKKVSLLKNDDLVYKIDVEKIKCNKGEDHLEIDILFDWD